MESECNDRLSKTWMIDSTDSDKEKTGKITRSRILDAFKGIGMLMIVSIHVLQWSNLFPQPGVMNNIRTSGLLGVEITFIINAFLLARSYDSRVRGGYGYILAVDRKIFYADNTIILASYDIVYHWRSCKKWDYR